jgi:hypothetical protein
LQKIRINEKTVMEEIIDLINEMSPFLLLGFLIAGIMHAFIPNRLYSKYLSGNTLRSVVNAALFGVPLPLCSCGVIPTAMSLRREGASKGATVSFLIATPQTGVDSIFATYSLMGLPFTLVRPIAAFVTALLGGVFVNTFKEEDETAEQLVTASQIQTREKHQTFWQKVVSALRFGFIEMMEDIGKWLVVGLVIAGLIAVFVPNEWFAVFKDNTLLSMLLVLAISIPMYVCATGSIPIAVVLMMKGLTPGSALVLLMAGPACNAASMLVVGKVLGRRTLVLYLCAITAGAIAFGAGVDYLLPREWFTSTLTHSDACCHEPASWYNWASTILLGLLLLNVLRMRLTHQHACSCHHHGENEGCSCHHHHEEGDACGHTESLPHGFDTREYTVKGMSCNHCRTNVEKVVKSLPFVKEVSVDLPTGKMVVAGENLVDEEIQKMVESIGFSVEKSGN